MTSFKERDLAEHHEFSDPIVSIHLEFKFIDGFVVDNEQTLTSLVKDVKIVNSSGKVIKSDMEPLWLRDRPFFLLFPIEGLYLPPDAKVRLHVAQNVPQLITILPTFWSRRRIRSNL